MTIGTALRLHLVSNAGVNAIVNARVFPLKFPQDVTMPCITFEKVSGARETTLGGDTNTTFPRFRFHCWSKPAINSPAGYTEVTNLADRVRVALQGFRGVMGGTGGVPVNGVSCIGEFEKNDPEAGLYRVISDFVIAHKEATS